MKHFGLAIASSLNTQKLDGASPTKNPTTSSTTTHTYIPTHSDDPTPAENASLDGYRDAVPNAIRDRDNIILVGHSMAGMVISAITEAILAQIKSLVYLCAYLPQNGENLYQLSSEDKESLVGTYWRQEHPESYSPASIASEGVVKVF